MHNPGNRVFQQLMNIMNIIVTPLPI